RSPPEDHAAAGNARLRPSRSQSRTHADAPAGVHRDPPCTALRNDGADGFDAAISEVDFCALNRQPSSTDDARSPREAMPDNPVLAAKHERESSPTLSNGSRKQ